MQAALKESLLDGRIDEDGNKVMKLGKRYVLVGMVE